jgi:hypothetical protein
VHLIFRPNTSVKAHWNNEAAGLTVWINRPVGWELSGSTYTIENPPEPVSHESRRIEFELFRPHPEIFDHEKVNGYALYYVCEDIDGNCLYRRQDFSIPMIKTGGFDPGR